ncbi:hypothetical protein THAOC_31025 [Thalassiosira oceanica]|uniref:Uncharacterized protein n=1 Tax=Thalassiosira oceanica TaxID=159749 RepID=K0RTM3_THAOC|nr:hypothetical protein THAOC_31025 [Thalassiosira oceanica]|mmetsp:Transcript_14839/g.33492  ORF Transcript_14839/g.33492 Transcript_14839/m.33492 type:complete len:140 (-) Transcript_14839:196-615(-)|eukprot:EJK50042.1 hypothetical protein THAOC_31025 [Thalassiosira oceanica]
MVRISTLLIALSVGLLAQLPSAFVPSISPPVRTGRTGHHDDRFTLSMSDATFQPPSNGKEGANEVDELRSHFRERGGAIAAVSLLISAAIVNPQALSAGFSMAFSSVLMYCEVLLGMTILSMMKDNVEAMLQPAKEDSP